MNTKLLSAVVTAGFIMSAGSAPVSAENAFPAPGWEPMPDPLASPHAVRGGSLAAYAGAFPKSFNYYLDNNTFNDLLMSLMFDTLLTLNPVTAGFEPCIAESWTVSDDGRAFSFRISPDAKWSDGKPVTPEDVAWTFNALRDPANLTGVHKVSLEKFDQPEIASSNTVRFTCREVHWRNLLALGSLYVLPRHVLGDRDFNKINTDFPAVSGPYRISEIRDGVFVRLERRPDWWRDADPRTRNTFNISMLTFRFYEETENAFEAFKKGLMDVFPVYTSHLWVNETKGERFEKHWVVKQRVHNYHPQGFQGFAMNMRRPPFDSLPVRRAMAHLLNREEMNRTLMYGQYFMHRSYFEDLYSPGNPCPIPMADFNPSLARTLLSDAGWSANPRTGLLEKDGRPLSFSFLTHSLSTHKFLSVYNEALRDAGIEMKIEMKDAASWSKDMDNFNFDMTWAAWGSSMFKDPEGMWASAEADRPSGNNITGFRDREVDRLIEEQRTEFDLERRNAICRRLDALIAAKAPYALLWNISYTRLLYWNKFGTPPTVLSRHGNEDSIYAYWWSDPDAVADLKDAMESGSVMPAPAESIRFDEAFRHGNE